ncbi:MAG: transglycosylase SLT domain-containing protein, partial [Candidatus Hydrogenedentes bacterium]|nr:transglycosylase SLT domain-containing protein [Candidatus Hydrogenedentota bacterium]
MRNTLLGSWYACATMAVVAVGCATGPSKEVHQFRPMPVANVGAHELAPVTPKTASDLLQAADEAFKRANTAQEQGDDEAALRNYKQMLELLVEADLDPKIFYNLRSEFERILDRTTQQARLFDRLEPPEWLGETPDRFPVVGDLEIPFPWPERVQAEIDEILELYPKNYQGGLDRYHLYGAYIRRELAAAGLPKDLVWLAMVESQFHPTVVSPAGAAGLWQFMRETGRRYGLRIDNYVDERYNWQKATHAAIAYLTELNQLFDGNWPLAISSYNMGEYGMGRTVAANGGEKDIWKLIEVSSSMREETRKFYPKLLASMIVAASYDRYGFSFNTQPPEQFIRVPVKGSYSLAALEQASNLSSGTLKRLNPDLTRGVTPPNGDHMMAVPIESETLLMAALEKV